MTGRIRSDRAQLGRLVVELHEQARIDSGAAWWRLTSWAATTALTDPERRSAHAAATGSGRVQVAADASMTVSGSWFGAPVDGDARFYVVPVEADGRRRAVAVRGDRMITRTYATLGARDGLTAMRCRDVPIGIADLVDAAHILPGIAAVVAGLAHELIARVTALARTKIRSGTAGVLLEDPIVVRELSRARIEVAALFARLVVTSSESNLDDAAVTARVLIDRAEESVGRILAPTGSSWIYLTSPLQRLLRDLTTVARHAEDVPDEMTRLALGVDASPDLMAQGADAR